jgi:hypothetical protein
VHWHLGTDQISMLDPAVLMLDAATSRTFFDAVVDLFTSEGFAMQWGAPQRWYLADESLATMATASLDRVIGRNVDAWLGRLACDAAIEAYAERSADAAVHPPGQRPA